MSPHTLKKHRPRLKQMKITKFLTKPRASPKKNDVATVIIEPAVTNRAERMLALFSQIRIHGRFHHYEHVVAMHEGRSDMHG